MRVDVQVGWRQLGVVVAMTAATLGFVVWWSLPARSQVGPETLDTFAFVARADNPVDALAASSVAGQLGAPVYLTFPAGLDDQAAQGLSATDPAVVVLAGGTAALSETVEQQIGHLLPDARIVRKAGFGRTETAKLINELTGELGVDRPVLAGATVAGDVGVQGKLTVAGTDVVGAIAALTARVDSLESQLADANGRIAHLESTLTGVSRNGDTLVLSGMNVQLVNGQGATSTTNGLGNLIVGYNEDHTASGCVPSGADCRYAGDGAQDTRTGSHNLIVGVDHSYSSYGGVLAGRDNTISGIFASVSGGSSNTASGSRSSVSGGQSNIASGALASVTGGDSNTASGDLASVSGGFENTASRDYGSVSGGAGNTASSPYASVSGGAFNTASGDAASVSGGFDNTASAQGTSVAGGRSGVVADAYDSRIGDTDFPDG